MKLMKLSRKKLILLILAILVLAIVLFGVIYQQTSLWKPEQSLITLLPESPICHLTFKDLKGIIKTFNRSEFGKQAAKMPILSDIKKQLWWKELVYQKQFWEYEMGGRLDLAAFNGHFGKEVILALYEREGEVAFLLITEVGGKEKLAIEAVTATEAIDPRYERIQTEYEGFTINTITGFPLDFSYTFIGKIGMLSLNPLLLAEVIDIYGGKKSHFLVKHPKKEAIQQSYENDVNTGYIDIAQLAKMLKSLKLQTGEIIEQVSPATDTSNYLTFGNRGEDSTIISNITVGDTGESYHAKPDKQQTHAVIPNQTALVIYNPQQDFDGLWETLNDYVLIETETEPTTSDFSTLMSQEMTIELISIRKEQFFRLPSIVIHIPIKHKTGFINAINEQRKNGISVAGKPVDFLKQQSYSGISIQPIRLRLNLLMALTGAYTVVDNDFYFSTTTSGLESVLDTRSVNADALSDVVFSKDKDVVQTYIQPDVLIPEIKKYLPTLSLLVSLTGQKMDSKMTDHITQNLFPLESLGLIAINVRSTEKGVDTEIRIKLEK